MHVVVVEGSGPVRERLAALAREHTGADSVGQAEELPKAFALIEECRPDLAIIGSRLGKRSAFDLLRSFRPERRPARVILLCGQLDAGYLFAARRLGVDYVLESPRDLEFLPRLLRFLAGTRADAPVTA